MDLKEIRKKITKYLLGLNNIDRLMTDKINDYILIEEPPLPIRIGNKTIYIGSFNLEQNNILWDEWLKLLAILGCKQINFDLLDNAGELYKHIMINRIFQKELIRLIGKCILKGQQRYIEMNKYGKENIKTAKWKNCSLKYFMKNVTVETLLQICKLVFKYNFDSEKKNLKILIPKVSQEEGQRELMETYMYFWLQNLAGVTGEFQRSLYPAPDYWQDESMRVEVPLKKVRNAKTTKKNKI